MPIFLYIVAGFAVVMALCAIGDITSGATAPSRRVWGGAVALVLLAALCITGAAALEVYSCT